LSPGTLRVVIHNGDDAPLQIRDAVIQQYERRLYFDCTAGASPTLLYGDPRLDAPVYDYAKLFQNEEEAAPLEMHAEEMNAAYTGRPDDRPWTDRHPAVVWSAIIGAVLVLSGVALRSLRASPL